MARAIWQKTVTDNTGAPSNGAQITVTIQGGGAATIFSAQSGGSARTNPFTTGTDGIARFYAERGYYNVSVFKDGSTVSFPWNNLGDKNLFDDLENTAFVPSTAFAQTLLDDANASAARTTLGLGTAAVKNVDNMGDINTGSVSATKSNAPVLSLNRLNSDGDALTISKAGTEVLKMGTRGGLVSYLVLDPRLDRGGAGIGTTNGSLVACDSEGNNIDIAVDLGTADSRWKDLYLDSVIASNSLRANSIVLTGSTAQKASGTTWSNPSDIRLKKNVTDYDKGIAELMQIRVCEWEFNGLAGTELGLYGIGVIADEAQEVLPKTVDTYEAKLNEDDEEVSDIKKFNATEITWLLVNSVKQLQLVIEQLTARIAILEGE